MLKLRKVAVTGGLSCGKSSVCRFLEEFGAYVLSADAIVHQHLNPLTTLGQQVINLLGPDIVEGSQLSRSKIAQKVFHDSKLLRELEKLSHPLIKAEIEKRYAQLAQRPDVPLFAVEIPLLYEVGWAGLFDAVVAVVADPEVSKRRFMDAGHTQKEYEERMNAQLNPMEKARLATYVIENNGSLEELKAKVKGLFTILTQF